MVNVPGTPVTFAGGFAQGLRRDRAIANEEERTRIAREQVEIARAQTEQAAVQQRAALRSKQLSEINSDTKAAFDLFTQEPRLAKEPTTVALFEQSLETQGEALKLNGAPPEMVKAFSDRSAFQRQIVSQLASEDPAQVREAMEKLEAIKTVTEATGSEGEGRVVGGGLAAGTARPLLFVHKSGNGQQIGVDPLDMDAQKNLIASNFVPVPGGVAIQAGSLSEIQTPLTPSQVGAQAQESTAAAMNITQLSSILGKLKAMPGVAGIRGVVAEVGGGLVGQFNETLGAIITEQITGVSEEELQGFRTEARAALARSITEFSGEEGGRFTNQERALTDQALRLLKPDASFPQIKAATEIAMKLSFLSRDRNIFNQGLPWRFDLNTDEGILQQAGQLVQFGMSEALAEETIIDQINMRSLLEEQQNLKREQAE